MVAPPRAAPQDALRGAAAPGEAVGRGDGAAHEALGFDAVGAAQLAFFVDAGAGAVAVGAGDGAPQDALGFGAGGFGGAGAGALGAGAGAGAVGAGASTFFSFRRMNAACFTMVAGPGPPATAAGGSCATVAMQPAGPTPAARNATALGTELLLPPYWPGGCDELSCGQDHAEMSTKSLIALA